MIRKANASDIMKLAENMREADKQEVEALTGLDPLAALSLGLFHSDVCWAGYGDDGEIVGIWGITPVVPNAVGSVWLLSTDAIKGYGRELIRDGSKWLDEQNALYPVLTNVVTESNDVHIRLIKHLGFEFKEPIDNYGAAGVRVLPFERKM